jgi:hypothetical protein
MVCEKTTNRVMDAKRPVAFNHGEVNRRDVVSLQNKEQVIRFSKGQNSANQNFPTNKGVERESVCVQTPEASVPSMSNTFTFREVLY